MMLTFDLDLGVYQLSRGQTV